MNDEQLTEAIANLQKGSAALERLKAEVEKQIAANGELLAECNAIRFECERERRRLRVATRFADEPIVISCS